MLQGKTKGEGIGNLVHHNSKSENVVLQGSFRVLGGLTIEAVSKDGPINHLDVADPEVIQTATNVVPEKKTKINEFTQPSNLATIRASI